MDALGSSFAVVALVAVSLLSGCGSYFSYAELNPAPPGHPPRAAEAVDVYSSAPPTRAHVDVRVIEALQGFGEGTNGVVSKLRAEAGREGCDAIYLRGVHMGTMQNAGRASATCLMYTDGGAPPPAAPAAPPAGAAPVAGAVLHTP
jgi:hypothetical protein